MICPLNWEMDGHPSNGDGMKILLAERLIGEIPVISCPVRGSLSAFGSSCA